MKSYYDIAIQLEVFHDYFPAEEGHICPSLRFTPSEDCFRKLKQNHLIFKNTVNGFVLVGERRNTGTDAAPVLVPVIDIAPGTKFCFLVTEVNNDFINITDTDPKLFSGGKKYVFRNTNAHTAVINGNIATVVIQNYTPLTEAVTIAPANFIAPVVVADNPVKLVLLGQDRNYITEKTVTRDSNGNISVERITFSDTPFEEGIYFLQQVNAANTVVSEKEYFLINSMPLERVNGIVVVDYNNILSANAGKEIHVVINLAPRNIHWVYKVDIERYEEPLDFLNRRIKPADLQLDVSTSSPSVGTPFTKTVVSSFPNPADWFMNDKVSFRSNNPVPLVKKPYQKVLLKNTAAVSPVIIKNMPNPEPLMIKEIAPNTYEAEMFVKVK